MTTGNERASSVKNFHKNFMQFSVAFSKSIFSFLCEFHLYFVTRESCHWFNL